MEAEVTARGVALRVRDVRPSDRGYIAARWGNAYRKRVPAIREDVYREENRKVIDACLDAGLTVVVCSPDKETALLGFACGEPGRKILHGVYLENDFRGHGLGRQLIAMVTGVASGPVVTTHRFARRGAPSRFVWNPYLARYHA